MKESSISAERLMAIMEKLNGVIATPIDIYLIGGSAMEVLHHKAATKDIDIVVEEKDANELTAAMRSLGLRVNERVRGGVPEGEADDAVLVDLFAGQICGRMSLTDGMRSRSHPINLSGKARVHAIAGEDIFLLKSVTERERDTDEMLVLLRAGIDWKVVVAECDAQDGDCIRQDRPIYESFLAVKLEEMERRHGIQIPWKGKVVKVAEQKMLDRSIFKLVERQGAMNQKEISDIITKMGPLLRRRLMAMVSDGLLEEDEESRFIIAKRSSQ